MVAVAIDGPGGAGKSTAARAAAKQLGFIYVDTGALYRAIGLHIIRAGVAADDKARVCAALADIHVELKFIDGEQHVLLCGSDVSGEIRTGEVSMAASMVSAIPAVRDFLFGLQQDMAAKNNVVMDGRDIGTVVLPNAQVKIFLTASPEERARRRYEEMIQKGQPADYETVLVELKQRDYQDMNRATAPLKPAADAVTVDSTGMTAGETVAYLVKLIQEGISCNR